MKKIEIGDIVAFKDADVNQIKKFLVFGFHPSDDSRVSLIDSEFIRYNWIRIDTLIDYETRAKDLMGMMAVNIIQDSIRLALLRNSAFQKLSIQSGMDPDLVNREFKSVTVALPRQIGTTTAVKKIAGPHDLIILNPYAWLQASDFGEASCVISSSSLINQIGKQYDIVFIDTKMDRSEVYKIKANLYVFLQESK